MAHRLTSLLLRHRAAATKTLHHHFTTSATATSPLHHLHPQFRPNPPFSFRFLSTRSPRQPRSARPDIAARARQMQNRRLWAYALTFSCIAGFVVIVLNQFEDQLVFYITPSEALEKYHENPTKSKFRLGGLVLEGSVADIPSSHEMQFVVTDLLTDILVRYEGSLPDLFREGHSVVVEGFVKPYTDDMREKEATFFGERTLEAISKATSGDCYFAATEVLAKHDEKYMPQEVAIALEKNKKILEAEEEEKRAAKAGGEGAAPAMA